MRPVRVALAFAFALAVARPADAGTLVGSFDTPGDARHVAVADGIAYVADGSGGLRVLDVSVPAFPIEIGVLANPPSGGSARDVVVAGSRAYVVLGLGGVGVADVSNPAAPAWLGVLALPGATAIDVEVAGGIAFVGGSFGGARVVDFAVPSAPVEIATIAGEARDVELDGSLLWLCMSNGVYAYDVSTPSAPALVGQPILSGRTSIEVRGDLLYTSGLEVYDVSNPAAAVLLQGHVSTFGEVEVEDGFLMATGDGLWTFDADPDEFTRPGDLTECGAEIEVAGRYAYCADQSNGFNVYDVADPMAPVRLGSIAGIHAWNIDVLGDYAYVTSVFDGMHVIDVSNPASPAVVATFEPGVGAIEVWGDVAYVGETGVGIHVVDVSNPLAPFEITVVPPGGSADLELVGDRLYATSGINNGIRIFDVSTPTAPVLLGSLVLPGNVTLIEVQNGIAFLGASSPHTLYVVDVSVPSAPVQLASLPVQSVDALQIVGDLLYATHPVYTLPALTVFDVSNPASPVALATLPSSLHGRGYSDLRVIGEIGLPSDGIALDLSDPTAPRAVGWDHAFVGNGLEWSDGLAYVSAGANGIRIVAPSIDPLPKPECSNGVDDDGDGAIDAPFDATCLSSSDPTELPDCSDGVDNDRDGFRDWPADPSCSAAIATSESRPCSNGIDDDGDGAIDGADPQCHNGWGPEQKSSCGLGAELALAFAGLGALRRRTRCVR
jgi:hypothetical protein